MITCNRQRAHKIRYICSVNQNGDNNAMIFITIIQLFYELRYPLAIQTIFNY